MSDFKWFKVEFDWETDEDWEEYERLEASGTLDEDAWFAAHTWTKSLYIKFDEDEFDAFHQSDIFNKIEEEYGILDVVGHANRIGFTSDEISPENMSIVWEKLVEGLKSFLK